MLYHAIGVVSGMTIDGIYHVRRGHLICFWFTLYTQLQAYLITYSTFEYSIWKSNCYSVRVWDSDTNL